LCLIDLLLGKDLETNNETTATGESTNGRFKPNGSVNAPTVIEEILKMVFSVGSSPRLHNEDLRPAEGN
jgi:hypothetical protein